MEKSSSQHLIVDDRELDEQNLCDASWVPEVGGPIISLLELLLQEYVSSDFQLLFSVHTFSISQPLTYFQLFSHAVGHANWEHYLSNFSFILLLGPLIEEKYGSRKLFMLIAVTSLITGVLFVLFFDGRLLGASGIVFMLIILHFMSMFRRKAV